MQANFSKTTSRMLLEQASGLLTLICGLKLVFASCGLTHSGDSLPETTDNGTIYLQLLKHSRTLRWKLQRNMYKIVVSVGVREFAGSTCTTSLQRFVPRFGTRAHNLLHHCNEAPFNCLPRARHISSARRSSHARSSYHLYRRRQHHGG